MLTLESIPDTEVAPADAKPTLALTELSTAPAARRTILRAGPSCVAWSSVR
jgi:hypothetical protein